MLTAWYLMVFNFSRSVAKRMFERERGGICVCSPALGAFVCAARLCGHLRVQPSSGGICVCSPALGAFVCAARLWGHLCVQPGSGGICVCSQALGAYEWLAYENGKGVATVWLAYEKGCGHLMAAIRKRVWHRCAHAQGASGATESGGRQSGRSPLASRHKGGLLPRLSERRRGVAHLCRILRIPPGRGDRHSGRSPQACRQIEGFSSKGNARRSGV